MKSASSAVAMVCGLLLASAFEARAQFPAQDMGPTRLGVAYEFLLQGQDITRENVGSEQVLHGLKLGYAPVPYVTVGLGMGISRFETSPYGAGRFEGEYGFCPSFFLDLASPGFLQNIVRATLGVNALYLSSEDKNGLNYSAFIVDPSLGLKISALTYLDIDFGGRLHLVEGTIQSRSGTTNQSFSNGEAVRGYGAITLKSPYERVFIRFEGDVSPGFDANWSNGPIESSLRLTVGGILGWKGKQQAVARPSPYFPNYREMKARQDVLVDEIEGQE